jgi:hypothetical protein
MQDSIQFWHILLQDNASFFSLFALVFRVYVIHVFFYYHTNIGDVIHSFTDGIAVGGAYAKSFYGGLGTTIAIVCHEVPHCVGKTS